MQKILGGLGLIITSAFLNGLALKTLWDWFIVRYFGIKALTIPEALGLALIVSYTTYHYSGKDERNFTDQMGSAIAYPLVVLFLGWVYTWFL